MIHEQEYRRVLRDRERRYRREEDSDSTMTSTPERTKPGEIIWNNVALAQHGF
jgi:hypothetical protein